jgi:signal transduction histidine kinase
VDLNAAIREVLTLAQSELHEHHVTLRIEWAAGLPLALADKVQLQQVVLNLIVNAIEAVRDVPGQRAEIVITTLSQADGCVCVSVRDNGCGVDPEHRADIFEAFYTSRRGGMGMGLAISRTIVENHGGKLWLEPNEGPDPRSRSASHRTADTTLVSEAAVSCTVATDQGC